jgi:hypothetical protein
MNVDIKHVESIELGEVLEMVGGDRSHRTIIITTAEGQVVIHLYATEADNLRVIL